VWRNTDWFYIIQLIGFDESAVCRLIQKLIEGLTEVRPFGYRQKNALSESQGYQSVWAVDVTESPIGHQKNNGITIVAKKSGAYAKKC